MLRVDRKFSPFSLKMSNRRVQIREYVWRYQILLCVPLGYPGLSQIPILPCLCNFSYLRNIFRKLQILVLFPCSERSPPKPGFFKTNHLKQIFFPYFSNFTPYFNHFFSYLYYFFTISIDFFLFKVLSCFPLQRCSKLQLGLVGSGIVLSWTLMLNPVF